MTTMTHTPASDIPSFDDDHHAASEAPRTAVPVSVAPGDGIGPEIMKATLLILREAGALIDPQPIAIGAEQFANGHLSGIAPEAWDQLRSTGVLLKGPITTPSGKGVKSLNVTLRKTLGLYANVRPCPSHYPVIASARPGMDVVIIRENEEDTYAGIEHRQTAEVTQCLKLITQPGCEKIVRYAFEYARAYGRKRVTCMIKDNIHKLTDGLFASEFARVAAEYPDIEHDRMIVDIGAAKLATKPENFDVIVTLNLYGDILSDIAGELTGSVGLIGTSNIGQHGAMFEAVHGTAPDIAGQGIANPSGLLLAAVQMLVHLGQSDVAQTIHNAWLATLEDGLHPGDIYQPDHSAQRVGTMAFAEAVIERLGKKPQTLPAVTYTQAPEAHQAQTVSTAPATQAPKPVKQLVGTDIFLDWDDCQRNPEMLAHRLEAIALRSAGLKLKMITNRGVKVWPEGQPETFKNRSLAVSIRPS